MALLLGHIGIIGTGTTSFCEIVSEKIADRGIVIVEASDIETLIPIVNPYEEILKLELQTIAFKSEEFYFKDLEQCKTGWYNPKVIGKALVPRRQKFKATVRKQYNKPRFIWRTKKQKKYKL